MDRHSDQTSFVYTTYIHATPERVWQGLTDPQLTIRWWRHHSAGGKTFESDWKKGSTYDTTHPEVGLVVSDPEQVILQSDPYRRLAYRWHTFTPEWVDRVGMDEAMATAWRAEPRSTVTFDIDDDDKGVAKLTVIRRESELVPETQDTSGVRFSRTKPPCLPGVVGTVGRRSSARCRELKHVD